MENNNIDKTFNFGYFLKLSHIEKAHELLIKQIEDKHPLYNNLDFRIYRQEIDKLKTLDCKKFYHEYVRNDCFYHYQDMFYLINYTAVQGAYKIRKYNYLSPRLLLIYYGIGIYIRETLSRYHDEIENIFKSKNINTYYGGNINIKDTRASTIYYYEDYKSFLNQKEKLTKHVKGKNNYILSLDIKSYFYSINPKILLDIINKKAFSHDRNIHNFDSNTITTIEFFLNYLTNSNKGLVVSSQNLISNYLSHVYLSMFDHFVIDNFVNKYDISYIRYVDDFYIIWQVEESIKDKDCRKFLYEIENKLIEFLIGELELEINPTKSRRDKISSEKEAEKFMIETKNESPTDEFYDDYEINNEPENPTLPDEDEEKILSKVLETLNNVHTKINKNDLINLSPETIEILKKKTKDELYNNFVSKPNEKANIKIEQILNSSSITNRIILSAEQKEINSNYILRELDRLIKPTIEEITKDELLKEKLTLDIQYLTNVSEKLTFEKAISIIIRVKSQLDSWERIKLDKNEENILNKLILGKKNKGCRDYTHRNQAVKMIDETKIFQELTSIEFLLIKPKPFLHLITISDNARNQLEKYLLDNIQSTDNQYKFLYLVEKFILQLEFLKTQKRYRDKIDIKTVTEKFSEKLDQTLNSQKSNSNSKINYLNLICRMLDDKKIINSQFELIYKNKFLNDNVSLMQQIKQKVFYEKFGHYNVAFNNLLNEFHELFKLVYPNKNKSKLDAKEIGEHMTVEKFDMDEILFVKDFFNRRNKNSISHPNDADLGFWGVSKDEYLSYKKKLIPILIKLERKLDK